MQANPYRRGDPDVLACLDGRFVAFEVKLPGRERTLTKLQERAVREIECAGGTARMVTSVDEVLAALDDEARQPGA